MNTTALEFLLEVSAGLEDVDSVFGKLEVFEPPTGLLQRIMQEIQALPGPKPLSSWRGFNFFLADSEEAPLA